MKFALGSSWRQLLYVLRSHARPPLFVKKLKFNMYAFAIYISSVNSLEYHTILVLVNKRSFAGS